MTFSSRLSRAMLVISLIGLFTGKAIAQNSGDQILDGIGETGLIARYTFRGDGKDWSRNNLHAHFEGKKAAFVDDARFGKVLSLPGDAESYITLPGEALANLESLSVTGWLNLRSGQPGQYLFDFGKDPGGSIYAAPAGTKGRSGFEAGILTGKKSTAGILAPAIEQNTWVHFALVLDRPSKAVFIYINGKPAAEAKSTASEILDILDREPQKNNLYIGRALKPGSPGLNALLHDLRLYRVPLTGQQVAGIFSNTRKGQSQGGVNTTAKRQDDLPKPVPGEKQLYNAFLTRVSDSSVETAVGSLPRLPAYVSGEYSSGIKGPKVRVIWPAPADNTAVLKAGTYMVTGRVPGTDFQPKATVTVKAAQASVPGTPKLMPFQLDQVSLNGDSHGHETRFIENRNKFIQTLAKTDPDSFLWVFRHAFGQKEPEGVKPLGVWDSEECKLRGHATGHYLTALAQAYAGAGSDKALQANFARKMDYMVNTLYGLSKLSGMPKTPGSAHNADPLKVPVGPGKTTYDSDLSTAGIRNDYWNWGKGFISPYPPDQFIMLEKGAKYGGQKTQIWAPYYTLHKILAGLIDVYEISGNKKALTIATGMGDWVHTRLSRLPQDTLTRMWSTYIAGEFGGINESMARLYKITGDRDYLKTAELFDNIKVFYGDASHSNGLAKNVDSFRGLHANQHIPQIVGSIELYRVSQKPEYYRIADNFWHKAVTDYMYSIGGLAGARNPANAECFISQPASLYQNGFSSDGQNETCATYNMLKLTGDLFLFDQQAELMDYYERGLYNHILASVAENSPANTYHVSLRPGSAKQFSNGDMSGFTCCNGTALESSTKLQNSIYSKSTDNQSLYVNLFIPSTLRWSERNLTIEQTTSFPQEDNTQLTVKGSGKFDLHVRVPGWATKGFFVTINGKAQQMQAKPGTYLTISRNWKSGDKVELKMPMQFHLEPVMDQQNIASLFYGPVLLAAQEPVARNDWRKITLDAGDIGKSVKSEPEKLRFSVDGVSFKPFYNTYGRHSVYLDVKLK